MSEQQVPLARQGTRVTFLDQTGAKSVDAIIADNVIVKRILPNIVTKMNLPVMGPDGQPMSYSLDHKEGGQRLREDQTLVEAQVQDGDHLIVYPEIVAGAIDMPREDLPPSGPAWNSRPMASPRLRRLQNDYRALKRLAEESSIFSFTVPVHRPDAPPESYIVRFLGQGLARGHADDRILLSEKHEVSIQLGAGYPRMSPELTWRTAIFHPNISANGIVCLGGYSTHWVPSLQLDQLCGMLWNMIRYENYDVESPYNREAATWVRSQTQWRFPLDRRSLSDLRSRASSEVDPRDRSTPKAVFSTPDKAASAENRAAFLEDEVVDAEVVDSPNARPVVPEILFLDN